jgi:hypothetical protein
MANLINVLGEEITLGSATHVDSARVVRLLVTHTSTVKILIKRDTVTVGSFTIPSGGEMYIEKKPGDMLETAANGSSVLMTRIAYSH